MSKQTKNDLVSILALLRKALIVNKCTLEATDGCIIIYDTLEYEKNHKVDGIKFDPRKMQL